MGIRVKCPGRGHNEYGEGACRMGRFVKSDHSVSLCPRALQTGRQSQPSMEYNGQVRVSVLGKMGCWLMVVCTGGLALFG